MTSEEFEQQVARLMAVMEGEGARVSWNRRIPDPDNPTQLRQIDVEIRRGDSFTIVECRLHASVQDVQWVEELAGRRLSLRADTIIGVSASGFTAGAWRKGESLGVFLYDLRALTDEEVRTWGRKSEVRLSYVHFKHIAIFLVPTSMIRLPTPNIRTLMRKADGSPWPIDLLFRTAISKLSKGAPEGALALQCFTQDLFVGSAPVPELIFHVDWRWLHRDMRLPTVLALRANNTQEAEALVQKNNYSRTEITHVKGVVTMMIDVSLAPLEPASFFRRADIDLGQPLPVRAMGVIGLEEQKSSALHFNVVLCRRNSREYRRLMSGPSISLE